MSSFLHAILPDDADAELQELYATDLAQNGYLPNYTLAMSLHPAVIKTWRELIRAIKGRMPLRRYTLVSFAAARALKSTYSLLAHAVELREQGMSDAQIVALVTDFHTAGLEPVELAVMAYADQIAREAHAVTAADIAGLRALGLTDAAIMDVALAVSARSFICKALDATGAMPDEAYRERLGPELCRALAVGRPY